MIQSLTVHTQHQQLPKPQKEKVSFQMEEHKRGHEFRHESRHEPLYEPENEIEHRTFYLAVLALLMSVAAFGFSGLKPVFSLHKQLVVVDMNQLLRRHAADIIKHQADQHAARATELNVEEQARHIRAKIEEYATKNQVIVVTKGAVFGSDLTEVTDEIQALL